MNVLSLISIGVAAALIVEPFVRSRTAKKRMNEVCEKENEVYEKEREEYRQRAEYNRAHLPSKELPPIFPDWDAVNRLIEETRFRLYDEGEVFRSYEYDRGTWTIPKSDFDSDTLKLLDLIKKDMEWFYGHHTGCTVGECGTVLEGFLREKYPLLSDRSISCIRGRYCINDR